MKPLTADRTLLAKAEAGQLNDVREAALDLFVRANAGADITAHIPRLLGLADSPYYYYAYYAAPALTLFAIQKPDQRELVLASLRGLGAPHPHLHSRAKSFLPRCAASW